MPKLTDLQLSKDMETQKLPTGNFSFTSTRLENLGAAAYTLCTVVIDLSGSTAGFRAEMEKSLKTVVRSCKYSPQADNLMLRVIVFADDVFELHGFKLLANCNEADYENILQKNHNIGYSTALFDATINGIEALTIYSSNLVAQDYGVNGAVFIITDGCNNKGKFTPLTVRDRLGQAITKETLESLISVLIGINVTDTNVKAELARFQAEAGLSQYIDAGQADEKTLAKLADFISKSISSQSQAIGTGLPSQPMSF
jgi:uncharacterized protein YegL